MKAADMNLMLNYFSFRGFIMELSDWILCSSSEILAEGFMKAFESINNLCMKAMEIMDWYDRLDYAWDYTIESGSIKVRLYKVVKNQKFPGAISKDEIDCEDVRDLKRELKNYRELRDLDRFVDSDEGLWKDYYRRKILEVSSKLIDFSLTLLPSDFSDNFSDFKKLLLEKYC